MNWKISLPWFFCETGFTKSLLYISNWYIRCTTVRLISDWSIWIKITSCYIQRKITFFLNKFTVGYSNASSSSTAAHAQYSFHFFSMKLAFDGGVLTSWALSAFIIGLIFIVCSLHLPFFIFSLPPCYFFALCCLEVYIIKNLLIKKADIPEIGDKVDIYWRRWFSQPNLVIINCKPYADSFFWRKLIVGPYTIGKWTDWCFPWNQYVVK